MNVIAAGGFALAGALAGIPVAAIAYSAPAHGGLRIPRGWWHGAPARRSTSASISLLTGATSGIVTWSLTASPVLPAFWIFAVLGVGLAIIDLRRHRLPHAITGILAGASVVCFTIAVALGASPAPLLQALAAGLITASVLLMIALALPGQLGLGDVVFSGVIALNLGWLSMGAVMTAIVTGFLIQGGVALVARTSGATQETLSLGPALLAGWLLGALAS
ncbi:prepilin peptidase [Krasilnikovia sp. MM14-A1259]|uniref:prepilin peptidase n=1 Tax=Krasilnikovia sp. MM14-A1259 TaxID=3373539 RepID=UPI0037F582FC